MHGKSTTLVFMLIILALPAGVVSAEEGARDLVARLPGGNMAEGHALIKGIVDLGAPAMAEVCTLLTPPGEGDDSKARFALHGMALYVTRPGADGEQKLLEGVLLDALSNAANGEIKAFLIRQVQLVGRDRSVAPLAGLLGSERLCEPATQALLANPSAGAKTALEGALEKATGKNLVTILTALGRIEDRSCVDLLLEYATVKDPAVCRAAWYALSRTGDPRAVKVLEGPASAPLSADQAEAASCYLELARRLAGTREGKEASEKMCRHIIETRKDPRESHLVCAAQDILGHKGAEAEEGFVSLFNGRDLSGWVGDTEGHAAKDGILVCKPGDKNPGNLWTEKDYKDFVLRFEFKLTPGANNGLAIRTPLGGHAAYEGMELQILDNGAEVYKNLQPYQYHGSVYGVIPAKRGHQKPVGEWNVQEVTARGRCITVKLNGAVIVDGDLDKASTPKTMDGQAHPGLKLEKGRIGLLGHGARVEFRNIRIKEL